MTNDARLPTYGIGVSVLVAISVLLAGCEAPLTLEGVEKAQQNPIHRTDRYQAAARHGSSVVVVGNQGVIIHSQDNGTTWGRVEVPDWPALIDVAACPNGTFVALAFAPITYISVDAGVTWVERALPPTESPQALTCAPDNKIWVVGAFTYRWSSNDNGATWNENTDDEDAILTTVQFFDADNGIITGEFGTVMVTDDGGENWQTLAPLADEFYPQTAYFENREVGWIGGLGGVILYTADGGQSWAAQTTETEVPIYGIEAVGENKCAVGGEGTILCLDGETWRKIDHDKPIRLYLRAIQALDNKRAIVAGVGGSLHIIDMVGA